MSLLMKALEKASQERRDGNEPADGENRAPSAPSAADARPDAVAPAAPAASDLTLEPLFPKTPSSPASPPPEPRATPAGGKPSERPDARRDSARAATVMRASRREESGPLVYMRDHPMVIFSALVGLFIVGYGTYLYLQIYHPALFLPKAPPVTVAATRPVTAAPGMAAPAAAPVSGLTTLKPMAPPAATPPAATPTVTAAAPAPAAAETPAAATRTTAAADVVPQAPAAPRDRIRVTPGGTGNTVNPALTAAYGALQSGDLDAAQRDYALAQKSEPANPDVWLGLAALASRRGDNETAARHYLKALELDPGNAAAQAGFIGLTGRADPGAAESRLKDLISRQPTAFLYTALGSLYADQGRWAEAQQAYFDAHHMQPDNPDYAYNLAVGLEHIGQPALAVNFYKRALGLAATAPARFDTAAAQARIDRIERGAR